MLRYRKLTCPIWGTDFQAKVSTISNPFRVISDRAGGAYQIDKDAIPAIGELQYPAKASLTTWLVDRRLQGDIEPRITRETIEYIKLKTLLSVNDRANRFLQFFVESIDSVAENINEYVATDDAYAWSESMNWGEIRYFLSYLEEMGWIRGRMLNRGFYGTITVAGYSQVEEQRTNLDSSQGFVAMWFHESMNEVYDNGIRPGIVAAGYSPLIINRKLDVNKIDDEIIGEIRRSRFLVADFTHGEDGARGGVYFEAGFAQGLGIPVIYSCRYDMIDKLHFDTRQYAHIVWKDSEELRRELRNRIIARIGEGPESQTTS